MLYSLKKNNISNYITLTYATKTPLKIKIIKFSIKNNLNNEIKDSYKDNPDLIIIKFKDKFNKITLLPRYPIYINNTIYITPICYEQINGFTNDQKSANYIIKDFINRCIINLGGLVIEKFKNIDKLTIHNTNKSIIHQIYPWMTKHIPTSNVGWLHEENKIVIYNIFKYYKIYNIAELGCYFGLSTKYFIKYNDKLKNIYCFDLFNNILLADYKIKILTPLEKKFFLKYNKFETFHANTNKFIQKYNPKLNLYSIKLDCFKSINYLKINNVKIDLFYIDFCKDNRKILQLVEDIFINYPNCIIFGDDGEYLQQAIIKIQNDNKYICLNLYKCYLCVLKTNYYKNIYKLFDRLKKMIEQYNYWINLEDLNKIKYSNIKYQINYIIKKINKRVNYNDIILLLKQLNINPNTKTTMIYQNGNIYHYIGFEYNKNKKITYLIKLYNRLIKIWPDNNVKNNLNLIPNEYFIYDNISYFI